MKPIDFEGCNAFITNATPGFENNPPIPCCTFSEVTKDGDIVNTIDVAFEPDENEMEAMRKGFVVIFRVISGLPQVANIFMTDKMADDYLKTLNKDDSHI